MKKPRHPVTDHAVLRYLERVHGVNIDGLRNRIGRKVDRALEVGASGLIVGGFVYRIEGGRVVTVVSHNQPNKCIGRRRRRGT